MANITSEKNIKKLNFFYENFSLCFFTALNFSNKEKSSARKRTKKSNLF